MAHLVKFTCKVEKQWTRLDSDAFDVYLGMKKIPEVLKLFIVLSPGYGTGKMHLKYTKVISTMQNCLLRSLIFYYGNNWWNYVKTF